MAPIFHRAPHLKNPVLISPLELCPYQGKWTLSLVGWLVESAGIVNQFKGATGLIPIRLTEPRVHLPW